MRLTDRISIMIPGIEYEVKINETKKFYLSFIHKTKDGTVTDGLTTEDLLAVLINRIEQQDSVKSDMFNNKVLYLLRESKRWIENRSYNMRNFKNKQKILRNE